MQRHPTDAYSTQACFLCCFEHDCDLMQANRAPLLCSVNTVTGFAAVLPSIDEQHCICTTQTLHEVQGLDDFGGAMADPEGAFQEPLLNPEGNAQQPLTQDPATGLQPLAPTHVTQGKASSLSGSPHQAVILQQ